VHLETGAVVDAAVAEGEAAKAEAVAVAQHQHQYQLLLEEGKLLASGEQQQEERD
jgi:hypothetical protein